jgi:hypothetical protein
MDWGERIWAYVTTHLDLLNFLVAVLALGIGTWAAWTQWRGFNRRLRVTWWFDVARQSNPDPTIWDAPNPRLLDLAETAPVLCGRIINWGAPVVLERLEFIPHEASEPVYKPSLPDLPKKLAMFEAYEFKMGARNLRNGSHSKGAQFVTACGKRVRMPRRLFRQWNRLYANYWHDARDLWT